MYQMIFSIEQYTRKKMQRVISPRMKTKIFIQILRTVFAQKYKMDQKNMVPSGNWCVRDAFVYQKWVQKNSSDQK